MNEPLFSFVRYIFEKLTIKYDQKLDLLQIFSLIPLDIHKLELMIKATRYRKTHDEPTWLLRECNVIKSELMEFPSDFQMIQAKDHEGLIEDCLLIVT